MLLPRPQHIVGGEVYTPWFRKSVLSVVQVFVRQVLNDYSSVVGESDLYALAKILDMDVRRYQR